MSTEAVHTPQRARKPPLADWPTIKILTPPKGRFSPKTDEWCLTYCSQTITGRIYSKEPFCRSLCIRRVFAHEVKNIVSFKSHRSVGADGKANYPLPSEGQPENVPRFLGGDFSEDTQETSQKTGGKATKIWDEGWYLWTSQSRLAIHDKTNSMMMDLAQQRRNAHRWEQRKEVWQDYQDYLQGVQNGVDFDSPSGSETNRWWGPIVPPRPIPEFRAQSLLIPLPPDIPPFWARISKLLAPSYKVIDIFRESWATGEQKQFAHRVWEKTWSNEPFVLAGRTLSRAYERWKDREVPPDEDV